MASIPMSEVQKHNSPTDCWVVLHGKVYDITPFLEEHPGGSRAITLHAGKDATKTFDALHSFDMIDKNIAHLCKGSVDGSTVATLAEAEPPSNPLDQKEEPPLDHMLNVFQFEEVAKRKITKEGYDYISSGADDEITLRENHSAFHRIWFRPRILIDVANIDTRSTILGYPVAFPLMITATALGRLVHPEGEVCFTRAAANHGVIQMVPTLASASLEAIFAATQPGQIQFFQLYVNRDRKKTRDIVERAEKGGCKALFITVDAPVLGRRERDMRNKFSTAPPTEHGNIDKNKNQGTARAISTFIDPSLNWKDIAEFRTWTKMPIVLKGVQCAEDAVLAYHNGCSGVVLSNHGGRQLDFAPTGIELLPEVMAALRNANVPPSFEVFIDGGVRRGSDIFKAIALGAKAVAVGRPILYGSGAYGQAGVERVLEMFRDELEMTMRLCGAPSVGDIRPEMVRAEALTHHSHASPQCDLHVGPYVPLSRL
eukprot:TRINITY_DN3081_c0_g1_i1.p1 TRINITY_DN3081_c0_g1~~TRINITY_DN3081_c0_g1_i1.p1  ORF type:complete len:492 (-),score=74.63 TRINITY_DN3081_c0_g1_i1:52-1503(-)